MKRLALSLIGVRQGQALFGEINKGVEPLNHPRPVHVVNLPETPTPSAPGFTEALATARAESEPHSAARENDQMPHAPHERLVLDRHSLARPARDRKFEHAFRDVS
ncbi:hypothetical protein GCM10009610_37790 [Pseudonocardia xinjiangensis]